MPMLVICIYLMWRSGYKNQLEKFGLVEITLPLALYASLPLKVSLPLGYSSINKLAITNG